MRSQESGPSKRRSMLTSVAPAATLLSMTSATACGKSYPRSRSEWTSRLADGRTLMAVTDLDVIERPRDLRMDSVGRRGIASSGILGSTDGATECVGGRIQARNILAAPYEESDCQAAIRKSTLFIDPARGEARDNPQHWGW